MKEFIKKIFDIHSTIGKVCTGICIFLAVAFLIGLITGTKKFSKIDDIVETNFFIQEDVPIHDSNYKIIVTKTSTVNEINTIDKKGNQKIIEGNFISVDIQLSQTKESLLKAHPIDKNDFKLKDHTGVYVPLNDIMGAVGWDAIDVHFDEYDGGHVMSSTDFNTVNCYEDYNYIGKVISAGANLNFTIYYKIPSDISVEKDLIVMEVDFYYFSDDYKKGTDIILLNRPENLESGSN